MALYIVATPIGNSQDISLRALETFRSCDVLIGEERSDLFRRMKAWGIEVKQFFLLNEHTPPQEVLELAKICQTQNVALISDCGTPVFCDPGSQLIALCRKANTKIITLPGASSLMGLISLSSRKLGSFIFIGFLPANSEEREVALQKLKTEKRAMIFMDTPYRLQKTLIELAKTFPGRQALLVKNLTSENEEVLETDIQKMSLAEHGKAEFMLLLYEKIN